MPSPAYAKIHDHQGNTIKSYCQVSGRENCIEVLSFYYGVEMPIDKHTGMTTGVRQHQAAQLTKAYCPASPILFDAACHGKTLQQVIIDWYRIDAHGKEEKYFSHQLKDVKIVAYQQQSPHIKLEKNQMHVHEDIIALRFSEITMTYHEGNIQASDKWIERD